MKLVTVAQMREIEKEATPSILRTPPPNTT